MNITEKKDSLRQSVLVAYRDDYKELADNWRSLEGKAQSTIAIAGIFIAVAFAFVRELSTRSYLAGKILLTIAIASLIISIVLSVLSLRIKTFAAPLMGDIMDEMVSDLLQLGDDDILKRESDFFTEQAKIWQRVKTDAFDANESKAIFLRRAQIMLLVSIMIIAVLTAVAIYQ